MFDDASGVCVSVCALLLRERRRSVNFYDSLDGREATAAAQLQSGDISRRACFMS